jgi:hypothetical protein
VTMDTSARPRLRTTGCRQVITLRKCEAQSAVDETVWMEPDKAAHVTGSEALVCSRVLLSTDHTCLIGTSQAAADVNVRA